MDAPANPNQWRNIARHEGSFNDAIYHQLKKTPWWFVSIGFHVLIIAVLFSTAFGPEFRDQEAQVESKVAQKLDDQLDEEFKPVIEDEPPVEQDEKPDEVFVDTPVVSTETDNDMDHNEPLGELDLNGDAPFDGLSTNATIGIDGGGGGSRPGLGGRKTMRANLSRRNKKRDEPVDRGLQWLADHQDPGGFWDCDGFMKMDRVTPICDGAGNALYDPGVTGLALLAFLGAGETHKHGAYKKHVRNGLRYLKQIQDPEGCFGPRTTNHFTYNHAIAALAMAEAYAMTMSPVFKHSAQAGIDFIHKCQNPYLAWRYGVRPQDNDTSVSGWMIMALKSAKIAGLRVDPTGFQGMKAWIDKATEPEYGRVGYTSRGTGPARPQELMDQFPADKSESLTAVGILSRIFVGEDPQQSEMILKGTDLCLKALPVWDEQSGAIDMYYWYYGSLALFQVGGHAWDKWNDAMVDAIIGSQRKDGAFSGSWDPVGPWGGEGGRVYATALMVMCMEVYYRYERVFGAK